MRTIPIHVDAAKLGAIHLGKQGESLACRVRFYASKWHEDYPEAEYQLFVSPPGATPYLANITEDNGVVTWELAAEDTTIPGTGSVELILTDGETKIKSVTYRTTLDKSPSSQEPGGAPQVHPTWWENAITKINEATEEAVSSIDGALESEKAEAKAAIAKAAEEAIASIPDDYTALAGEVSSLKDQIVELADEGLVERESAFEWHSGRLAYTDNQFSITDSNKYLYSDFIDVSGVPDNSDIYVDVPAGLNVFVRGSAINEFGQTTTAVWNGAWVNGNIYTHAKLYGYDYIILSLYKDGNVEVTPSDASGVSVYSKGVSGIVQELRNGMAAANEKASTAIQYITEDSLNVLESAYTKGRLTFTAGEFTFAESNTFCCTGFMEFDPEREIKVNVPAGYDAYGWFVDSPVSKPTAYENAFSAWASGEQEVVIKPSEAGLKYLRLSIHTTDYSNISADDAKEKFYIYQHISDSIENQLAKHRAEIDGLKSDVDAIRDGISCVPTGGQIVYQADKKSAGNHIVNAVAYDDGVIIACRSNGTVVRIGYNGVEETVLTVNGTGTDWRCLWMDESENVFASPHASWGTLTMSERGLYKLQKGASAFVKVLSFDGSTEHDETIWTMCEDGDGYLYAGVYGHTKRYQPRVYRSFDNGDTWTVVVDFTDGTILDGGRHIHSVIYSKWQNALYTIVGEKNTILKSIDHGVTWEDLHVTLRVKGSAMYPTPYGILIGSDGAYNCEMDFLYNDDVTHDTVFSGWANTVFAIRCSDVTGILYAFTKIDSSVNDTNYFPPASVLDLSDPWTGINEWKTTVSTGVYNQWKAYYDSAIERYPEDAIRPSHYAILVSRNGGKNWEVLKRFESVSTLANGFWTTGYFKNGECLTGRYDGGVVNPLVISEGKHKYVSGGCDLDGEIFVRTNAETVVNVIR